MAKNLAGLKLLAVAAMVFSVASWLVPCASADGFTLGGAANYAVLYEGTGGHTLQITNVTINGDIGVGGTGLATDSGPSIIGGGINFSASNTGQFSNNNIGNVITRGVNYNVAAVTGALSTVNALSTTLGGEAGTAITINGNQTINASSGTLDAAGNEVFTVTSYTEGDGKVLTIIGNGHNVVLNLAMSGNPQLGGDVILTGGLTDGQVLWNYTGTKNLSLNNNASSYPLPDAFMGIILAPDAAISLVNANLDGSVFGGDSSDMQIVSGTKDTITAPLLAAPEPGTIALLDSGLVGLLMLGGRRKRVLVLLMQELYS
jgi:choice-of-anchor A domain-containing protein